MTTFAQPFHDYEILDRVGGGAMGTVFKARHKSLNRIVALKVLKPSLARDKRYVERLRREARIVASLSHPNIVTGYDLGEESGYHFFVMEFVEGKSLRQLLVEWGMFAEEYVLRVAREVAMALDHAYQRGVIHRDIKPGNILIDETGCVKLTDMGLAKGPADLTLTRDGATVGTPMYISPEQARNPQDVDVRSDLYSLGATLYHMATGVPPFHGDTMAELITKVLNENVVPPDEANSAVSSGVSLVIRKLLAKNLTVRYQTPRELLDDLDRIERAQPPAVDAGRLDVDSQEPGAWVRLVLFGMAAVLLAALAWWVGQEMRDPVDRERTPEQFLADLDRDLHALPTPGARFARLNAITITSVPAGSAMEIEERRKAVATDLQNAVDDVVHDLLDVRWPKLLVWLDDPSRWPDRTQFEREHLQPMLQAQAGIALGQLPSRVRLHRVDALQQAVDRALAARDAEFQSRFEQFLSTSLPTIAEKQLRSSDFAGAERLWRDAVPYFCNGVAQPLPERLSDDAQRVVREKYRLAYAAALGNIDRAEAAVVMALQSEVATVLGALAERLAAGTDPMTIDEALRRVRAELGQYWPPASSFRVGHDPWPGLEQQLRSSQHAVDLALATLRSEHFDRRCDFAWRVFCNGTAVDALAVLGDLEPETPLMEKELQGHRRALAAAVEVERGLLAAIAAQNGPPVAFPLNSAASPVELTVVRDGDGMRLVGRVVGQPPRAMYLTELRLGDLLVRLGAANLGPLSTIDETSRALGLMVLRLAADDAAGIERHLAALPAAARAFLIDDVLPRIQRVRAARGDQPVDRGKLFTELEQSLAAVEGGGQPTQLESAILACSRVPEEQCSMKERRLIRNAKKRFGLARRQRDLREELASTAPRGAEIDVLVQDSELVAVVALPAAVLFGDVGEGWQLVGDMLEFAGGVRPWSQQPQLALRADAGLDARSLLTRVECELAFPPAGVGRRFYLLQVRGVSCALVLAADDSVQVALVDGDPLREDRAQRAFEHALFDRVLAAEVEPSRAIAIPNGVHLLTIEVTVTKVRTQAMVRISFEGQELLNKLHAVDTAQPPTFVLHPLQELKVRRVVLQAAGL